MHLNVLKYIFNEFKFFVSLNTTTHKVISQHHFTKRIDILMFNKETSVSCYKGIELKLFSDLNHFDIDLDFEEANAPS